MSTINLLYRQQYIINDKISVRIPTVGDIIDKEDTYYNLVTVFTAMPIDLCVQLADAGVDFTTIDEYELFLLLFNGLQSQDTSMILGDLDLSKFKMAVNEQNNTIVLIDDENDIKIDRAIHGKIAMALRKIHHLEKDIRKPANDEAKDYFIERARKKQRRMKNKNADSQLESLIISMVNTEQFKYDFESTRNLSIYQFNESVRQIINKIEYDNRMHGVYAGTVSVKDLKQEDLNWIRHK